MAENLSKDEIRTRLQQEIDVELPNGWSDMDGAEKDKAMEANEKLGLLVMSLWFLDNGYTSKIEDHQLTSLEDYAATHGIDLDSEEDN